MQAVSRLYGRRIRGDIGPLNTDPRTRLPGAILAPAVSLTGAEQYYDVDSAIQHFTLGSRMQLIGGRVFYYARAGGTLRTDRGAKNSHTQYVAQRVVTPILAGATQIVVTVTAADGILANGTIGLNELAGGHIIIFPDPADTLNAINREIVANTAVSVATTLAMTVTLDRPTPIDLVGTARAECMAGEYSDVTYSVNQEMVVGLPMIPSAINRYLWLQTWGPLWMAGQLDIGEQVIHTNNRQVVFRADGSLGLHSFNTAEAFDRTTAFAQHAGFVMAYGPGGVQGAPFVFLQITP